jgi:hypothetical protein
VPDDPLDDYLATLRAAGRLAQEQDPDALMDAIAQAIADTQWHAQQHRD